MGTAHHQDVLQLKAPTMELNRFILLPRTGYRLSGATPQHTIFSDTGHFIIRRPNASAKDQLRVVGKIADDGPRLIECSPEAELLLRQEYGAAVRLVPVIRYQLPNPVARIRRDAGSDGTPGSASRRTGKPWRLTVRDAVTGKPIMGAHVVAFTSYRWKEGDAKTTGADGSVRLYLNGASKLDRLYVYPPATGYWGGYKVSVPLEEGMECALTPLDLIWSSTSLHKFGGDLPDDAGRNVRVGIIDTGLSRSHPGLVVAGGRNLVFDETENDNHASDDWDDLEGHGSHVGGIVAARQTATSAVMGVAPGVELRAYRVFPRNGEGATNFDIMKAIEVARRDGCHIINLSLGGPTLDEAVRGALADAQDEGVLSVCAAGNDGRQPVAFPAANEYAMAVSAIGDRDCFPICFWRGSRTSDRRSR
jgi:subtilisin